MDLCSKSQLLLEEERWIGNVKSSEEEPQKVSPTFEKWQICLFDETLNEYSRNLSKEQSKACFSEH